MTETELIDKYICQHIEPEGDYLYRLYRATNIHTIHGRMASGHIQGRLLKMLVQMVRPKNILEVGTFSGYSAICLAQGLQAASSTPSKSTTKWRISPVPGLKVRMLPTRLISASAMPTLKLPNWV